MTLPGDADVAAHLTVQDVFARIEAAQRALDAAQARLDALIELHDLMRRERAATIAELPLDVREHYRDVLR